MKRLFVFVFSVFALQLLWAQRSFEGTLSINYQKDNEAAVITEVKIKGPQVYIKQTQNGNKKYDFFVLDLYTQDFYTVSTADKKVVIRYNYETLTDFYEANKLKEGYHKAYNFSFKQTEKNKEENGLKLTKATGETEHLKAEVWSAETSAPLAELIPTLRLIGSWNEAEGVNTILEAALESKHSKAQSTIKVVLKKADVSKDTFRLPKGYLEKDFSHIMEEEKANSKLAVIVQTFTSF